MRPDRGSACTRSTVCFYLVMRKASSKRLRNQAGINAARIIISGSQHDDPGDVEVNDEAGNVHQGGHEWS